MDSYRGNNTDPLSLNLYTYCSNNPVMYVDPSGHMGTAVPVVEQGLNKLGEIYYMYGPEIAQGLQEAGDWLVNNGPQVFEGIKSTTEWAKDEVNKGVDSLKEWLKEELGGGSSSGGGKDPNKWKQIFDNLSKGKIEHVLKNHSYNRVRYTIDAMMNKGKIDSATKFLNDKTFFNPKWSEQQIIRASYEAYNNLINRGVINGTHTVKVFNEAVTVNIENGIFRSAYGDYILKLSDFGF